MRVRNVNRHAARRDQIVTNVIFLLVPRVHLLDLAGPAQVFSAAARAVGFQDARTLRRLRAR
jgi:hypothetical protein